MVQRGDTLFKIALEMGQAWRDIAAWNSLDDPNRIEVGQTLRVLPPEGGAVAQAAPVRMGTVEPRTAAAPAPAGAAAAPAPAGGAIAAVPAAPGNPAAPAASAPARPAAPETPPAAAGDDEVAFAWPAKGTVVESFNDVKNKGVDIAGKAGDPVFAAADGQVVYAGSGLRGYGNLIIVKHNATYLTAYAHNQALVVKEGQRVKKGQKIAEMGSSDADRVKLHFEIRRQGRPVDPAKLLPDKP
ncbi:MAG TPA: peptidoglycan DD-metalloendopeptidase family protein [Burkholderiaceae bacterium]|nr:peptidoglycan DD-metalloendopeptidase family protein [Burkholderiaceae bacterium]